MPRAAGGWCARAVRSNGMTILAVFQAHVGRRLLCLGAVGLVIGASAPASSAQARVPVRVGCPSKDERVGIVGASFNETVAAAQRVLYREVTHYQGRRERRTAINTPVVAVVIGLGFQPARLRGQRQLLAQA